MSKVKFKVFADLSYLPFGLVLLLASVDIWLRAMMLFSIIPSVIVGLKSSRKNDVWESLHFVFSCWLQPYMRIELAIIGIIPTLGLSTNGLLLMLALTVSLMPVFVWGMKASMFAVVRASWNEDVSAPLFRNRKRMRH